MADGSFEEVLLVSFMGLDHENHVRAYLHLCVCVLLTNIAIIWLFEGKGYPVYVNLSEGGGV